jgi:hypothetical protein
MAGEAQPSFMQASQQNYDPSLQEWADAYKPVDKALNKMFETRITNDNARQEQYELAIVSWLSLSVKQLQNWSSTFPLNYKPSGQGTCYVHGAHHSNYTIGKYTCCKDMVPNALGALIYYPVA